MNHGEADFCGCFIRVTSRLRRQEGRDGILPPFPPPEHCRQGSSSPFHLCFFWPAPLPHTLALGPRATAEEPLACPCPARSAEAANSR